MTQAEKHAAVQLLTSQRLSQERIAERLGCDVKTVWRYSEPVAVPATVTHAVAAGLQPAKPRPSLKRETDVYPRRA